MVEQTRKAKKVCKRVRERERATKKSHCLLFIVSFHVFFFIFCFSFSCSPSYWLVLSQCLTLCKHLDYNIVYIVLKLFACMLFRIQCVFFLICPFCSCIWTLVEHSIFLSSQPPPLNTRFMHNCNHTVEST